MHFTLELSVGLKSRALSHLSMALQDIERGQSLALFKPVVDNRPKDAAKLLILKAVAAAAMQLLMDSGKIKTEAASIVATRLDFAGFRLSGNNPQPADAGTIARWRDKFRGRSDKEGAHVYGLALQEARTRFPKPEQQAKHVMQCFKRLVGNLEKHPS